MIEFETARIAFQNASLWATYTQAGMSGKRLRSQDVIA